MKKNNKKGFTIVELVIVIAVIAILAAVLIPTFSNVIKKAKESSDIQAMKNMNTYLAIEDASKGSLTINDVYKTLHAQGLNAKDYKPLYDGRLYFYDQDDNRIVYTDMDYKVLFGENEGKTKAELGHTWLSLSGEIGMKTVTVTNGAATISTAEEFYYLFSEPECRGAKKITITADIDAMGANVEMNYAANSGEITIDGQNHSISNAIQNTYKEVGTGVHEGKVYISGFIPVVNAGNTVTLKDLTFKDCYFGDLGTGMVGIIGKVATNGKAVFDNVDIDGCTFNGNNKVGSFVGWVQGSNTTFMDSVVINSDCSVKKTTINSSKGESGKLIGAITNNNVNVKIAPEVVSTMENVKLNFVQYGDANNTYEIYRGPVHLNNANGSNATQPMLDKLSGIIIRNGNDYRPFCDEALFSMYGTTQDGLKVNGVPMNYFGNADNNTPIVSFGTKTDIKLIQKCWYVATELPQQ